MRDGMLKVGPSGEIFLCAENGPIGNVKECDIAKIWVSDAADSVRQRIACCRTNCPQMINCYFED